MIFRPIVVLVIFSTLLACHSNLPGNNKTYNKSDTVVKDIPLINGKYPYYYTKQNIFLAKLGLDSLERGYDSLHIRIRLANSMSDRGLILEITRKQHVWSGRLYKSSMHFFYHSDSVIINSKTISDVKPKSNWDSLMQHLYKLKVLDLRDQSEIPNGGGCGDGDGAVFEIATRNKYRIYSYSCYDSLDSITWQAKNVELIVKTLESEFDFKRSD
jgi:hypothetical protein